MVTSSKRITIEDSNNSLKVIIPSKKQWSFVVVLCILFLPIWAAIGIVVGVQLGGMLMPLPLATTQTQYTINSLGFAIIAFFSLSFLGIWGMMGLSQLYIVFWHIAGKEVVHVKPRSLVLCRQIFGHGLSHKYLIDSFSDLRVALPEENSFLSRKKYLMLTDGSIMFNYGGKSLRFGIDLGLTDATYLVATIKNKFPQYRIKRPVKLHIKKLEHLEIIWIILVGTAFLAGGNARILQQATGLAWLDSLVPIFGGLYIFLLGLPFILIKKLDAYIGRSSSIIRLIFSWMIGLPFSLLGISCVFWGLVSLWGALH